MVSRKSGPGGRYFPPVSPPPAEVARRLKAARWLAGSVDANGKPRPLSTRELAARPPLPANRITANRLEEIEQMKITPPPMELERIALALGVPVYWLTSDESPLTNTPDVDQIMRAVSDLAAQVAALKTTPEGSPGDTAGTGGQGGSATAASQPRGRGTR